MSGARFVTYDRPFASMYAAVMGLPQDLMRYETLPDLLARFEYAYSELGLIREQPDTPDRAVIESYFEDEIRDLGTEIRRRQRSGQEIDTARREAGRYPEEFIRSVKGAYDLRDVVLRDTGLTKPITGNICSPLRAGDHTPSFSVKADRYHDYGTGEHGDVIAWRMRWHGVSFWQALESLAVEAGITLPGALRRRGLRVREVRHGRA